MGELVTILDGNVFLVSDVSGDVDPSPDYPTGLFAFDTRFLSLWRLTIDGERVQSISTDQDEYFETRFLVVPGHPTHYLDAKVSAIRHRAIGGDIREDLTVLNHANKEVELAVRLDIGSDFADIFEIKNPQGKKGHVSPIVDGCQLKFLYRRGRFNRMTVISSTECGVVDEQGITFNVKIPAHGEWRSGLSIEAAVTLPQGEDFRKYVNIRPPRSSQLLREELNRWLAAAPRLGVGCSASLAKTYRRSVVDLSALRSSAYCEVGDLITAGMPWFMTLFGRDSIITCLQCAPFVPQFMPPTIKGLANFQGSGLDDFLDEEPGKIMHEIRNGESTAFGEQPHGPYFGAADTTALFLVLLDEYELWSGDADLVRSYELEARAALDWIDTYGDLLGTGYVWYQTRNPVSGLVNQCWKDSPDSISFRDGRLPGFPRATCEVQGYVYDAKVRAARLAREFWGDPGLADRLEREAAELKVRFNRDFWVEDGGYFALALDAEGRQVDALSSNIGHLLWSGIVDEGRASRVVEHLMGPALYSGWGVRTLAATEGRYNPLGYHVGTVWPFDNSIIAWGLWRYGFRAEAGRICRDMLEAAVYFDGRLPEAFAGYDRGRTTNPVEYPTACSPQSWSSGTPLLLLRVMLGLQPDGDRLVVDPVVPPELGNVELFGIPGRWGRTDAV